MSISEVISRMRKRSKADEETGGKLYNIWILILPIILGFSLGKLTDICMGYILDEISGDGGATNISVSGISSEENSGKERRGLESFLVSNPFRVTPQKPDTPNPEPLQPKTEPTNEPDTTLDEVILRGTLPGIGAWIEVKNKLELLLVGDSLDKYKLIAVNYSDVMFRKGDEKPVTKYITYGPVAGVKKAEAPKPPAPAKRAQEPPRPSGNIVAAVPDSQEGQIPGELVNNLVQNPFDELKRIRIRPNERAGGLEVQWIQNNSLLKQLGVQRGDVIRSVNGIPFTNMGDIANSISSLMTSERFDVEVTRGGKNTALRYVVK